MAETGSRLGVGLGVAPPGPLLALLHGLGRRIEVVDLGEVGPSEPALVRVEWDRAPERRPHQSAAAKLAWWLDGPSPALDVVASRRPVLVLSPDRGAVSAATERGIPARIVPEAEVEPESSPVAPFVRDRIRRARGLGDGLLVEEGPGSWSWDGVTGVDPAVTTTAMAVASAVYVTSPEHLVRALAWGCPTVATADALAATGATEGRDCVADDGRPPLEQLRRMADDPRRAAELSRAGRARYEAAHSPAACVDALLQALDLATRWAPSHLQLRLEELDSRRTAGQWRRFAEMVSPITNGGGR